MHSSLLSLVLPLLLAAGDPPPGGFSDEFDGERLHPRWQWHVPVAGPKLEAMKGRIRIELPDRHGGFNQWISVFEAPLLTAPAVPGDFDLEAHLRIVGNGRGANFHVGIAALISDRHVVTLGPFLAHEYDHTRPDPRLMAEVTGRAGIVEDATIARDVHVKMEKRGDLYRCYRRADASAAWTHCGDVRSPFPVLRVGIVAKTFGCGKWVFAEVERFVYRPVAGAVAGPIPATATLAPDRAEATLDPKRFGQFIEHLGKCIYGGLWAEMLENRKFAGAERGGVAERWEALGAGPRVLHAIDTTRALNGVRCQRVLVAADPGPARGIRQDGLALQAGREYVGRAVLRGRDLTAAVSVTLRDGDHVLAASEVGTPGAAWETHTLRFTAPRDADPAALTITTTGRGAFWVGAVSLMPADHVDGWRKDVLEAVRTIRVPVLRWPGGNFVSGYRWRDGLGDRDRRPPRWDPAWRVWESNDVGTHEFFRLCELLETEPYLCLNLGNGSPAEARDWFRYCVEPANGEHGARRAKHGRAGPWPLRYVGLGNEMYGHWQVGHLNAWDYGRKARITARLLRRVDPKVRLVLVGVVRDEWDDWNRIVLSEAAADVDYLAVHFYERMDLGNDPGYLYQQAVSASTRVESMLSDTARLVAAASPRGRRIPLCFDEWNLEIRHDRGLYAGRPAEYGIGSGLFSAGVLHGLARLREEVPFAGFSMMVNVMGAFRTNRTSTIAAPSALAFRLLVENGGPLFVPVESASPSFSSYAPDTPLLDAAATMSADRKTLYVTLVNRHPVRSLEVALDLGGFAARRARVSRLVADGYGAAVTFEHPRTVRIVTEKADPTERPVLPPHSVTALALTRE